jgi:hypothetical protein
MIRLGFVMMVELARLHSIFYAISTRSVQKGDFWKAIRDEGNEQAED